LAPAFGQAEGDIDKLIAQLGDEKRSVRLDAEKKLADLGEKALEQLRKAAKGHPDVDVRLRAVVLVGPDRAQGVRPSADFHRPYWGGARRALRAMGSTCSPARWTTA